MQATGGTAIAFPIEQDRTGAGSRFVLSPARARLTAALIGLAGFGLDLATKTLALAYLDPAQPVPLLGGLVTLRLVRNPGAAFSMGEGATVLFALIAIAAFILVVTRLIPRARHLGWVVTGGLLLAGVSGNLVDRLFREPGVLRGHVIDFIQLPYFAIFNVADMCITGAAILVVYLALFPKVSLTGEREPVEAS